MLSNHRLERGVYIWHIFTVCHGYIEEIFTHVYDFDHVQQNFMTLKPMLVTVCDAVSKSQILATYFWLMV